MLFGHFSYGAGAPIIAPTPSGPIPLTNRQLPIGDTLMDYLSHPAIFGGALVAGFILWKIVKK